MAKADFAQVLQEIEALESELDPMRLSIDEGEDRFARAPTARETAYRHLEAAVRHTVESARALIDEAEWDEPEDELDAIGILVEEDVLPERVGAVIVEIAEFATGDEWGGEPWESEGLYVRMSQAVDTLSEYVEYVQLFLKEWGE